MKRRFFAPLALVAALACGNQPLAPSSAAGLTLALTLTRTSLQRGESDTITITLTNTNPDTVFLGVGGCPLVFFVTDARGAAVVPARSEEHTSELQSRRDLVCRLLLEKKKKKRYHDYKIKKNHNKTRKT